MVATSYPRDRSDWQGLFIRKLADTMGSTPELVVTLWAPDGPRHEAVDYACDAADREWLGKLAGQGGIAHLLRTRPLAGLGYGAGLLRRLRRLYRQRAADTDLFHINWLQHALPLQGMNARAVITVLGTDFKLLRLPGMTAALRRVLRSNRCILAPNAAWMQEPLQHRFGDLAEVCPVNFGIDSRWFELDCASPAQENHWLCVLRVTEEKIGRLFEWGEGLFDATEQLHLVGPNQGNVTIPPWVHAHGPLPAGELIRAWYPRCCGFITLSEHSEGKPQVLLETMAAGMPVIASRIPAHEELILPGVQGYLVDSREALRDALASLRDPGTHRNLGRNCRDAIRAEYGTWEDCLGRYRHLYGKLL